MHSCQPADWHYAHLHTGVEVETCAQEDQHTDTITSAHVQSANAHTENTSLCREGSNFGLGEHSPIPPLLMMVVVETGLSAPSLRLP